MTSLILFFFLTTALLARAEEFQHRDTPGALKAIEGRDTVEQYGLMPDGRLFSRTSVRGPNDFFLQLPAAERNPQAKLLGILDLGVDGGGEVILGWPTDGPENEQRTHFQVFRGKRGERARLIGQFSLAGAASPGVRFYQPPDSKDVPKIVIDIAGGATWGTTYILAADGRSAQKLFAANDYEFVDLDRDGVYELIAWSRRPFNPQCILGDDLSWNTSPEIYLRSGGTYKKAWPPASWIRGDGPLMERVRGYQPGTVPWGSPYQIMAVLADLDGSGRIEIATLTSRLSKGASLQSLAVYTLQRGSFHLTAQTLLSQARIAFFLSIGDDHRAKQIVVWTAVSKLCSVPNGLEGSSDAGAPHGPGTVKIGYVLRTGRLMRSR